jgi:hypothetical protein
MLVRVALANKMARIVWALLARGGVYREHDAGPFGLEAFRRRKTDIACSTSHNRDPAREPSRHDQTP